MDWLLTAHRDSPTEPLPPHSAPVPWYLPAPWQSVPLAIAATLHCLQIPLPAPLHSSQGCSISATAMEGPLFQSLGLLSGTWDCFCHNSTSWIQKMVITIPLLPGYFSLSFSFSLSLLFHLLFVPIFPLVLSNLIYPIHQLFGLTSPLFPQGNDLSLSTISPWPWLVQDNWVMTVSTREQNESHEQQGL